MPLDFIFKTNKRQMLYGYEILNIYSVANATKLLRRSNKSQLITNEQKPIRQRQWHSGQLISRRCAFDSRGWTNDLQLFLPDPSAVVACDVSIV